MKKYLPAIAMSVLASVAIISGVGLTLAQQAPTDPLAVSVKETIGDITMALVQVRAQDLADQNQIKQLQGELTKTQAELTKTQAELTKTQAELTAAKAPPPIATLAPSAKPEHKSAP